MKKILSAGAAVLLTATVLAGCGGGSDDGGSADSTNSAGSYCDDLKSTKAAVTSLGEDDISQATFDKVTASVHTIAAEAPDDIKDDWTTIGSALDTFNTALDDAGISFDDLQKIGQPGGPTVDPAKILALSAAAKALDQDAISASSDKINKEVKSECGFELGFGS